MQPQCGFAEHTHTDACYTQVEDGAQETLTCTEAHEHNARCYGTWVVGCGKAEHTHTEACFPKAATFSAEQETATAPQYLQAAVQRLENREICQLQPDLCVFQ